MINSWSEPCQAKVWVANDESVCKLIYAALVELDIKQLLVVSSGARRPLSVGLSLFLKQIASHKPV